MNLDIQARCRTKLIEVARQRGTITYGNLAKFLGIANQGPWDFLDDLYEEERDAGRPHLTLVVVYSDTSYGRFNSEGGPARSIKIDPEDEEQVKRYKADLAEVYKYWATH